MVDEILNDSIPVKYYQQNRKANELVKGKAMNYQMKNKISGIVAGSALFCGFYAGVSNAAEVVYDKTVTLAYSMNFNDNTVRVSEPGKSNYRLLNISGGTSNNPIVISNATLMGGDLTSGTEGGGCILIRSGSYVELRNVVIKNSKCSGSGLRGGAIYNLGTLTLVSCRIEGSSSDSLGGAIYNDANELRMAGSTIKGCASNSSGGAIYSVGNLNIFNICRITENKCLNGNGGGIACATTANLTIDATFIDKNSASGTGANDGFGGGVAGGNSVTITKSTFLKNSASADGGGYYCNGATSPLGATISGSTFNGNSAKNFGGIALVEKSGTITNSTISENKAGKYAGGVGIVAKTNDKSLEIKNCTIVKNRSVDMAYPAGAACGGSRAGMVFMNSIFVDNTANGVEINLSQDSIEGSHFIDLGYNIIGNDEGWTKEGDWVRINSASEMFKKVGTTENGELCLDSELSDNGGLTKTYAIFSPYSICYSIPKTATTNWGSVSIDQREVSKTVSVDVGARRAIGAYDDSGNM